MAKKHELEHSKKIDEEALDEEDLNEDIYNNETAEELEENDEISIEEEGFMQGANKQGQLAKDTLTGEPLINPKKIIELKLNGKMYRFNSQKNADKFKEKQTKKI